MIHYYARAMIGEQFVDNAIQSLNLSVTLSNLGIKANREIGDAESVAVEANQSEKAE